MIIGPFIDAATCQQCLSKIELLWPNREIIGASEDPVATVRSIWIEAESTPPNDSEDWEAFQWSIGQKELAEKIAGRPLGISCLPTKLQFSATLPNTRGKLRSKNQFRALLEALERGDLSSDGISAKVVLWRDGVPLFEHFQNAMQAAFMLDGAGTAYGIDPVSGAVRTESPRVRIVATSEAPAPVRDLIARLAPDQSSHDGVISCYLPLDDWTNVLAAFAVFEKVACKHQNAAPENILVQLPFEQPDTDDVGFDKDEAEALEKQIEAVIAFATQPDAGKTWSFDLWGPSEAVILGTAWDRRGTLFEAHPTFHQLQHTSIMKDPIKPILALRYTGSAYEIEFHGLKNDPALMPIKPLLLEMIETAK